MYKNISIFIFSYIVQEYIYISINIKIYNHLLMSILRLDDYCFYLVSHTIFFLSLGDAFLK